MQVTLWLWLDECQLGKARLMGEEERALHPPTASCVRLQPPPRASLLGCRAQVRRGTMSPVLSALFCLGESFWKMLRDRQWARRQRMLFFFFLIAPGQEVTFRARGDLQASPHLFAGWENWDPGRCCLYELL